MVSWNDRFTCVTYRSSGPWRESCLAHLAALAADRLANALLADEPHGNDSGRLPGANEPASELANTLARFWSEEYYDLLFPLRLGFTVRRDARGSIDDIQVSDPFGEDSESSNVVDLDSVLDDHDSPAMAFRARHLEENKLPPILPLRVGAASGRQEDLLPERLLVASFIAACTVRHALARGGQEQRSRLGVIPLCDDTVSAARLGVLASPFFEPEAAGSRGSKRIAGILRGLPGVLPVASYIAGNSAAQDDTPEPIRAVLPGLRAWLSGDANDLDLPEHAAAIPVRFIVAAPQRIQRYIFESPGLKEIRGASALLDRTVAGTIERAVVAENGHEAVVRCAASTIEFLSMLEGPASDGTTTWRDKIRRSFHDDVGPVWVAVGEAAVTLGDIVRAWRPSVSGEAWSNLQVDRDKAEVGAIEVLPFEARCDRCRLRPASKRLPDQDGVGWLCEPCHKKVSVPDKWTRKRASTLLSDLEVSFWDLLGRLRTETADYNAHHDGVAAELAPSLGELPAKNARYEHNAVIFGDGNNFGGMVQRLEAIPATIQWSKRVAAVTRAAAALALVKSIVEDRRRGAQYRYIPLEVLTLGGDDVSFISAGTLALPLTRHLLELTDAEFRMPVASASVPPAQADRPEHSDADHKPDTDRKPVSFSFGVVICDCKAPIRIVSEWAEEQAMKEAKRMVRSSKEPLPRGTAAFIIANSLDNLPSNWDAYARELTHEVIPFGNRTTRNGVARQRFVVRSVMQPLDARQLGFLLDMADELRRNQSLVLSLSVAFRNCSPYGAILHYLYQRGRARGNERWRGFELLEDRERGRWQRLFGDYFPWSIRTDCEVVEPFTELLQIMKATQLKGGGDYR